MENNFNFSAEAVKAIEGLRHASGTFSYYNNTITRLFTYVLHCSDEIGMDEYEAINTLRALDALRSDIEAIAGHCKTEEPTAEEIAARVDLTLNIPPLKENPVRTLLFRAFGATMEASEAVNDALNIAENNGDKYSADELEQVKEAIAKVNAAVDYLTDILGLKTEDREDTDDDARTTRANS